MFEKRIKGPQNLNQSRINYSNDVHCTGIVVISYIAITLKKNHCLQFIVKAVIEEQLTIYLLDGPYYFHFWRRMEVESFFS